jgi:hypothetical protein
VRQTGVPVVAKAKGGGRRHAASGERIGQELQRHRADAATDQQSLPRVLLRKRGANGAAEAQRVAHFGGSDQRRAAAADLQKE